MVAGRVYPAGDVPPSEVAAHITNPAAWDGPAEAVESIPASPPETPEGPELKEPPRKGRGSGVEAWRTYAGQIGIELPDGASRDDILALVDARS